MRSIVVSTLYPPDHGAMRSICIGLLSAVGLVPAQSVVRGPYLQMGTSTGVVVRWRTDVPTDSRVTYGIQPGALSSAVVVPGMQTEHEVALSGLSPDTFYWYSVGSSSGVLVASADCFFATSPPAGAPRPTRVWVLGDSGTADESAARVRDAYRAYVGSRHTDLWLMLGDNAYPIGTQAQYQAAVFDMFPDMLRKSVLWPTLGNHDAFSTTTIPAETGAYYEIFTLPTAGQAGGRPSGGEAYYSFDHANVHFVCLNSAQGGMPYFTAMASWLQADLASTRQEWIVAFWHHAPYTKGSHDSDLEPDLVFMRQTFLPILEAGGVDLVLTGHSHSYERSLMIDGHYGASWSFDPATMVVNGGNGRVGGDGAYTKPSHGPAAHEGAVYAVAGSSGDLSLTTAFRVLALGGPLSHPVMLRNLEAYGSCVLEVWGSQLDVLFLDELGAVCDSFTIAKGGVTPVRTDRERFVGRPCASTPLDFRAASWQYHDLGVNLGTAWRAPGFNASLWPLGRAPLGFGDPGITTVVGGGNVHPTTYFRKDIFLGPDPSEVAGMRLFIDYDDGFVAWLNGMEVARSPNMPPGPISFGTFATSPHDHGTIELFDLDAHTGLLVPGNNTLAIEVHQVNPLSSDLFLDAELWVLSQEQFWRYEDSGISLGTAWRQPGFDDSGWSTGASPLGYGEPVLNASLASGPAGNVHPTAYFRKRFDLPVAPSSLESLRLMVDYDDGFVAWLNGTEVARSANMPTGPIAFSTLASAPRDSGVFESFDITSHTALLTPTGNVLAIEVHQWNRLSGDLVLEAMLDYDTTTSPWLSPCATGTVLNAAGEPESVLFVNGSDGGLGRSVEVRGRSTIEVRLEAPSAGVAPHQYVLAAFIGTPGPASQVPLPGLGTLCFNGLQSNVLILASTLPGLPGLGPAPALPLMSLHAGIPGPLEVTLQAIVTVSSGSFRVTNGVRVNILP